MSESDRSLRERRLDPCSASEALIAGFVPQLGARAQAGRAAR